MDHDSLIVFIVVLLWLLVVVLVDGWLITVFMTLYCGAVIWNIYFGGQPCG